MDENIPFDKFSKQNGDKFVAWKMWISKRIKETREKKECCIGMLSVLSSLSEEYLHKIETAEISPSDTAIVKISRALGVPRETFNPPKEISE